MGLLGRSWRCPGHSPAPAERSPRAARVAVHRAPLAPPASGSGPSVAAAWACLLVGGRPCLAVVLSAAAVDPSKPAPAWTCSHFSRARAQEWWCGPQGSLLRNRRAVSTASGEEGVAEGPRSRASLTHHPRAGRTEAALLAAWVRRSSQAWGRSYRGFTCISLKTDGAVATGLCSEGASVQTVPLLSATCPLGHLSFSHWLKESQVCAARGPVTDAWPGRGRVAGSLRLGGVHVGPRQLPSGRHRTGGVGAHRPRQSWGSAGRRVWGQKELPWKEGSLEGTRHQGIPAQDPPHGVASGSLWAGVELTGSGGWLGRWPLRWREEQGFRPQDPA